MTYALAPAAHLDKTDALTVVTIHFTGGAPAGREVGRTAVECWAEQSPARQTLMPAAFHI